MSEPYGKRSLFASLTRRDREANSSSETATLVQRLREWQNRPLRTLDDLREAVQSAARLIGEAEDALTPRTTTGEAHAGLDAARGRVGDRRADRDRAVLAGDSADEQADRSLDLDAAADSAGSYVAATPRTQEPQDEARSGLPVAPADRTEVSESTGALDVHDPHVVGFDQENDVPLSLRRELLKAATAKAISYYWLCAIYRKGCTDAQDALAGDRQRLTEALERTKKETTIINPGEVAQSLPTADGGVVGLSSSYDPRYVWVAVAFASSDEDEKATDILGVYRTEADAGQRVFGRKDIEGWLERYELRGEINAADHPATLTAERDALTDGRRRNSAQIHARLATLRRAIDMAYNGSAEHGSFLRKGGGEFTPSVFTVLEELEAQLAAMTAENARLTKDQRHLEHVLSQTAEDHDKTIAQVDALTAEGVRLREQSDDLRLVAMLLSHLYRIYDAGGLSSGRSWESRFVEAAQGLMQQHRPRADVATWPDREVTLRFAEQRVREIYAAPIPPPATESPA